MKSCVKYVQKLGIILITNITQLYIHVTVHRNKFLFTNQPDASIIQIYSVTKLHISGVFSAHRQEFSTVHSALVSFMQV
jgi:hypothetical protein